MPVVSSALWVVAAAATVTAMVAAALKSERSQRRYRMAPVRPPLNHRRFTVRPGIVVVNAKWEVSAAFS